MHFAPPAVARVAEPAHDEDPTARAEAWDDEDEPALGEDPTAPAESWDADNDRIPAPYAGHAGTAQTRRAGSGEHAAPLGAAAEAISHSRLDSGSHAAPKPTGVEFQRVRLERPLPPPARTRRALRVIGPVLLSMAGAAAIVVLLQRGPEEATGDPTAALGGSQVQTVSPLGAAGTQPSAEVARAASERRPATLPPDRMVPIAAGTYAVGCDPQIHPRCEVEEEPRHAVGMSAYEMDVTEVSVADYRSCVDAGVCSPAVGEAGRGQGCNFDRPDRGTHPINCVNFYQAQIYCEWLGKRLPTEAEWEVAALGREPTVYPWGDQEPACDLGAISLHDCTLADTVPVGSYPRGASPWGVLDQVGSLEEWTADWYEPLYYSCAPRDVAVPDPRGPPGGVERSTRGGDFDDSPGDLRIHARDSEVPWAVDTDLGFRCARSIR